MQGSVAGAGRTGVAILLLAIAATACGCTSKLVERTSSYQTEVTLSSLDCDVVMWRRIFFHDEHDTVVAEADSGPPLGATDGGCVVRFTAQLPRATFYVLDNGTRRSAPVTFDELKASHFQMSVRLR